MKKIYFPITLISLVFIFFRNAFETFFFKDDFFFLKISSITNIKGFINFFSPIRTYSYKPLASEVFYFFIHKNILAGHVIVFISYLVGLYFLYKSIYFLTKNTYSSSLMLLFYSLSSIHVYQLYWLATYQEVLVFTTLSISFYLYLKKSFILSYIFYICALFSKETAILYVVFLCFAEIVLPIYINKKIHIDIKKIVINIFIYVIISALFYLLYRYSLTYVTSLSNYKMDFASKRIINNALWYYLWSWGFPSFIPDYMTSVFSKPIPQFWDIISQPYIKLYLSLLSIYLVLFFVALIFFLIYNKNKIKEVLVAFLFSFLCFFIFLGPMLLFPHRWMVRLTVPMVFIAIFQDYILYLFSKNEKIFKTASVILIMLYIVTNYIGVQMNENVSTYNLESSISRHAERLFKDNVRFERCTTLYIKDPSSMKMGSWDGSEKIALTLFGDLAINYFIPNKRGLKVLYEYQIKKIPQGACIVDSNEFLN